MVPVISIIIPVYNVAPYIENCLRSVMRQTYKGEIECLIVDDCGTDKSMAIAERLIREYNDNLDDNCHTESTESTEIFNLDVGNNLNDGSTGSPQVNVDVDGRGKRIRFRILHHERNRGLSAARNTGMLAAKGEYLFFLDSDDELKDDCIAILTEPLKKEKYDFLLGFVDYYKIDEDNQCVKTHGPQELNISDSKVLRQPEILSRYKKEWAVVAWNRLYRTSFLRSNHLTFKEGLLFEDNLWSFQIACLASSLYIANKITYVHKMRADSIMDKSSEYDHVKNMTITLQEMHVFLERNCIRNIDVFPVLDGVFCFILNHYLSAFSNFTPVYKLLRPCVYAPFGAIKHSSRRHPVRMLNDLHYLLPSFIAAYWKFCVCRVSRLVKKQLM